MNAINISHCHQQIPTLKVSTLDHEDTLKALIKQTSSFPKMFKFAPIILDLTDLISQCDSTDFEISIRQLANKLIDGLRQMELIPIGIIGLDQKFCLGLGVSLIAPQKENKNGAEQNTGSEVLVHNCQTKIIKGDFRSGMTEFAKDSNLVIIGDVKRGSEVAAGGSIVIFGKLLGKAHAGCKFKNSVVTTTDLDPEIVSISGIFLANQNLKNADLNKSAIITMDKENTLTVYSC